MFLCVYVFVCVYNYESMVCTFEILETQGIHIGEVFVYVCVCACMIMKACMRFEIWETQGIHVGEVRCFVFMCVCAYTYLHMPY